MISSLKRHCDEGCDICKANPQTDVNDQPTDNCVFSKADLRAFLMTISLKTPCNLIHISEVRK